MNTTQVLPVFAVEVTETVTTRYRVRAADAERAEEVATAHNIAEAAARCYQGSKPQLAPNRQRTVPNPRSRSERDGAQGR